MKIAIIGAGASGLICALNTALEAKNNNLSVDINIFESKDKAGRKILATGNGRCNLMNENEGDYYFDRNGFSAFALRKFNTKNNLDFFKSIGLYTRSDEEGRIYPLSNQASSVLDSLRFGCENLGVKIICDRQVSEIKHNNGRFCLDGKDVYDKVVLACGGKAGIKSFNGYDLLKQTGHKVTSIAPSLTKIEVKDKKFTKQLKGIRQKGVFSLLDGKKIVAEEKGELLFTDYGISGIAVMQLSAYVAHMTSANLLICADFVPEMSYSELADAISIFVNKNPTWKVENLLSGFVAKKLGESIIRSLGINLSDGFSTLDERKIKTISSKLKKFTFEVADLKGFDDAQVTAGGADTSFFNPETMESGRIKGLYCIGELLDVDGLCGGYNLHWAWSSGRLCSESIIKELMNRKG